MTLWTQGVNSPPWQRRGGRAINKNEPKAPLLARPGWFVQLPIIGGWDKPPRLRPLRRLRVCFLMGAAAPPSPRRGVTLDCNLFTGPMSGLGRSQTVLG